MEETVARPRALMLRMGGVGDCIALSAVAKNLNKKYDVDLFVGSPTGNIHELMKLPYIKSSRQLIRINNVDAVKDTESEDFIAISCILKDYAEVFDYKNSIELNKPQGNYNKPGEWRETINSNYQNWVDLSLQWSNIDPTKVSDEDKRPEVYLDINDKRYIDWVSSIGLSPESKETRDFRVIGIQLQASTLVRSWYKSSDLPKMLHDKYPNAVILVFDNDGWQALTIHGAKKIKFDPELDGLLSSVWLIKQMDCFISADSGMSHLAEAVDIHTITIYTTVPAWTRAKYYKFAHSLESDVVCHPCFVLDIFCPLERKKAAETLTSREKTIVETVESQGNILELCRKFNAVPRAIQGEYESAKKRIESLSAAEPACVRSITSDMLLEKVNEILSNHTN
jgi:hypothetical protein